MAKTKHYRKRTPEERQRIIVQQRDIDIIRALVLHRRLRGKHIARLIPGSPDKLGKRLRKLYDQGFIDRDPQPWRTEIGSGSTSLIYKVGEEGARYLRANAARFGISEYLLRRIPAALAPVKLMQHRLGISDVSTVELAT